MTARTWARVGLDLMHDPRLRRAARAGWPGLLYLPWLHLFAAQADDGGRLSVAGEPADPDDLADAIPGADAEDVQAACATLANAGWLDQDEDGAWRLPADVWATIAGPPSATPAAIRQRVRDHRERKRGAIAQNGPKRARNGPNPTGDKGQGQKRPQTGSQADSRDPRGSGDSGDAAALEAFQATWPLYPRRIGGNSRKDAERQWLASVRRGADPAEMRAGTERYAAYVAARWPDPADPEREYVMQAATFYGQREAWREDWTPPAARRAASNGRRTPVQMADVYERAGRALDDFEERDPQAVREAWGLPPGEG